MIEWIPYDKYSRDIESHVDHLVTDGHEVNFASHAHHSVRGYTWFGSNYKLLDMSVTHYAKINLPLEVESNGYTSHTDAQASMPLLQEE